MRLMRKLRRNKNGFTLIELIMTMIVVGIIAVPISLLISRHIESVFESQDYMLARNLARLEMERVNNTGYGSIFDDSFSDYGYDITRTVSFVQGSGGSAESLKKISVAVTKAGSSKILAGLVTYLAKNISYGI